MCLCVSMYYLRIQSNIPIVFCFKKRIFPQKKFTNEKYIHTVIKIKPDFKTCLSKIKFILSEQIHIFTSFRISRTKKLLEANNEVHFYNLINLGGRYPL